jgi:hypothetical protein
MGIIEDAADHIQKGEIKIVGIKDNQITIQVDGHTVIWAKKNGRTLDSCDCPNHARFCNENPRCSHKLAASVFLVMKRVKI